MSDQTRTVTNQVFGLGLLTAFGLVFIIITSLFLSPAEAAAAAMISIILAATTYLVWRFDRAWSVTLGLMVTLAIAVLSFYTLFGLFQVFSPFEFIGALLLLVGIVFSLVGGMQALVRRRRDHAPVATSGRARVATATVIGVASLISILGFLFTRSTVSAAEAAGATVVEMGGFLFVPEEVSIARGETLLVKNSDGFAHDFTLDAAEIHVYYGPGSESVIDLSGLEPGEYTFFCSLHTFEGEGMTGTLSIEG